MERPGRKIPPVAPLRKDPPASPILAFLYAVLIAVAIYAATQLATVEPDLQPIALPLAAAIGIVVFLLGFTKTDHSQSGYLGIALSLLPALYHWTAANRLRQVVTSLLLILASGLMILMGPLAVQTYSIACDEATAIALKSGAEPSACTGALTKSIWRPLQPFTPLGSLRCFDQQKNEWQGGISGEFAGACGIRPLNAAYVINGIANPQISRDTVVGQRTSEGIQRLRKALTEGPYRVPDRRFNDRLVFATWNIRELGGERHGPRSDEAFHYIAEIISHFDIVAVQEVRDTAAVKRILALLGDRYEVELGYIAPGTLGNGESQGFIYDKRKIKLGSISTTLVIGPQPTLISKTGQPARPPFFAEFLLPNGIVRAATAHAYYGSPTGEGRDRRIAEISAMAKEIASVFRTAPGLLSIFAGDFNVPSSPSPEFEAFKTEGLVSDPELASMPSNMGRSRPYDQLMILETAKQEFPFGQIGVFPVFDFVYRDEDMLEYKIEMQKEKLVKDFQSFRSYQMSDHLPKWAEFQLPEASPSK